MNIRCPHLLLALVLARASATVLGTDGTTFGIEVNGKFIRNEQGQPVGIGLWSAT